MRIRIDIDTVNINFYGELPDEVDPVEAELDELDELDAALGAAAARDEGEEERS